VILVLLLLASISWTQEFGKFCAPCHSEQLERVKTHRHFGKGVACEICHGASVAHRTSIGASSPDNVAAPDEVSALCGECHADARKDYDASKHGKLVAARSKTKSANCGTCHGVHESRKGEVMKRQCDRCHESLPASCQKKVEVSANRLVCAACHVPHTLAKR
jgi:hypothetical protein